MATHDPAVRTRALARIAGPFLVIAAATIFARGPTLRLLLPAFMQDAPLVLATGAFTLMAGLSMFSFHHHWNSPPAFALSLLGLLLSLRGALLLLLPDVASRLADLVVRSAPLPLLVAALALMLGVWLSYVGWIGRLGGAP